MSTDVEIGNYREKGKSRLGWKEGHCGATGIIVVGSRGGMSLAAADKGMKCRGES